MLPPPQTQLRRCELATRRRRAIFCGPRRNIRSHGAICPWRDGSSSGWKDMRRLAGRLTSKPRKRARDEHIKNLPKGQMEILMTDDTRGTLHTHLHVRPPTDVRVPHFEPVLYPRLKQSRAASIGANLRFKSGELTAARQVRRMH